LVSEDKPKKKVVSKETLSDSKEVAQQGPDVVKKAFPDVAKTPQPAEPVPVPYPNVEGTSDAVDGSKKVKVEGKDVTLEDKASFGKSTGDEAGTKGLGNLSKINGRRVLVEAKKLLDYAGSMGPSGYQLLAITLVVGLAGGYGVGLIPYGSMKSRNLTRIAELEETISAQVSMLADYEDQSHELQMMIEGMEGEIQRQNSVITNYTESSMVFQGRVEELEDRTVDLNSTITVLRNSLSDAENRIQVYIDEVKVDIENDRIIVVIKNPSSLPAAITRLVMYTSSVHYVDQSEDATGLIPGGETVELVWSEQDASAPTDYIDEDSDYLLAAITATGYSEWHQYRAVKMGVYALNWEFYNDKITLYTRNLNLAVPFPSVRVIGFSKIGSGGPGIFYNITDPLIIDEGTLGGYTYMWNELAASAPEGFLRLGSSYKVRLTYGTEDQWITWDKEYCEVNIDAPTLETVPSKKEEGGGEW